MLPFVPWILFVAGGYGSNPLAYSYNGIEWKAQTPLFDNNHTGIGWNQALPNINIQQPVLCCGSSMIYSPDGVNLLKPGSHSINIAAKAVAWNGSMWVAVGSSLCAYSYNGVVWTNVSPLIATGYGVAWSGSRSSR